MTTSANGAGRSVPPVKAHVLVYFSQKYVPEQEAISFYDYFHKRKWKNKRQTRIRNWKAAAWNWILDRKISQASNC